MQKSITSSLRRSLINNDSDADIQEALLMQDKLKTKNLAGSEKNHKTISDFYCINGEELETFNIPASKESNDHLRKELEDVPVIQNKVLQSSQRDLMIKNFELHCRESKCSRCYCCFTSSARRKRNQGS